MTEANWLAGTAPEPMLEFLYSRDRNDRKYRLFVCACCRRIWHLLDDTGRNYVDVLEQYLDGLVSSKELFRTEKPRFTIFREVNPRSPEHVAASVVNQITLQPGSGWALAWNAVSEVRRTLLLQSPRFDNSVECKVQAALLREIFGNPFSPVPIDCAILHWQDAIVPKLAQGVYDQLAFDRLPILADALEEAGCTNADILNHCRQPGKHVRGCWVVDLLLGKQEVHASCIIVSSRSALKKSR